MNETVANFFLPKGKLDEGLIISFPHIYVYVYVHQNNNNNNWKVICGNSSSIGYSIHQLALR